MPHEAMDQHMLQCRLLVRYLGEVLQRQRRIRWRAQPPFQFVCVSQRLPHAGGEDASFIVQLVGTR